MNFFMTTAEIQEVLKESAVKALLDVTIPLERALEFLQREAPARYLVPSISHIVISDVTATAFFEALWRLDKVKAPEVAKAIGENAGTRFGDSLWDWLVSIGRIPGDDTALLGLWMQIDSSANWGTFDYSKSEGQLVIHLTNSFLTRSGYPFHHEYCSFLEGYVLGFMWTSLKELHHWLKGAQRSAPDSFISPPGVVRKCAGNICSFELRMQPDELSHAFGELMQARHLIRNQPYLIDAQILPLRRSLESAVKTKFELSKSDRWEHAMRAARSVLGHGEFLPLFKRAEEVHSELSGHSHANPDAALPRDRVQHLAKEAASILKVLESVYVGQEKKRRIQEEVARRQSGKPSQEPENVSTE